MAIWSVLTRDLANDTPTQSAERVAFVRDSFSILAFLFAPLMLLRHRLWLAFFVYVAVTLLFALLQAAGVPDAVESAVVLGLHLFVGLELPSLRVRKLRRRGYEEAGVVVAGSLDEAERRFFASWQPGLSRSGPPSRPSGRRDAAILGVLAEPRAS